MAPVEQVLEKAARPEDYKSGLKPVWCPGCGDYAVLNSLCQAFARLKLKNENTMVVSGIGCSSRMPGYLKTYGFNAVHGRALPIAIGAKLANPELNVIAAGGDGDGFSIGTGHFPHACRRNVDITYVMMDNNIYGLTKGQLSPTSPNRMVTKTSRFGSIDTPIDPISIAIGCEAPFVARAFSGDPKHLVEVLIEGIEYRGFSFIQVLSPCVTYVGKEQFIEIKKKLNYLQDDPSYDVTDRTEAFRVVDERERISVGIIYHRDKKRYHDKLVVLREKAAEKKEQDLESLMNIFRP